MNRAPAFQFYPKDWQDFRVKRMSLAAQGAYMQLLCFMWSDSHDQCSILDDDVLLARSIGTTVEEWQQYRNEIQRDSDPIFKTRNGFLVSIRLKEEAMKQRRYRIQQAEKGRRSAEQRLNRGSSPVQPEHQPESKSSFSSINREIESPAVNHDSASHRIGKKRPVMVPMPLGFTISESVLNWADKRGLPKELIEREFENFCNDRLSKDVQYADWDRAFMTWLGRNGEFALSQWNGKTASPTNGRRGRLRERIPL